MRILLTNDDGIGEPGLLALESAFEDHETWVVAPDRHCSGVGQSLGLYSRIKLHRTGERRWSVEGSPTDCVKLALQELMHPLVPDLVLSGINPGPNLANNVYYSGTVAAATEASFWGIPAFAVSQGWSENPDFGPAAAVVRELVDSGVHERLPNGTVLNVNVPPAPDGTGHGPYAWTSTGRFATDIPFDGDGTGSLFTYRGSLSQPVSERSGTDVEAFESGLVSLTLLHVDRSRRPTEELGRLIPERDG